MEWWNDEMIVPLLDCLRGRIGLFQLSWGIRYFSIQDSVSHGIAPILSVNNSVGQWLSDFDLGYFKLLIKELLWK